MYYRRIIRGGLLDGAYGGISLEVGRVSDPLIAGNPDGSLRSVALFVATDTPIGPIYLGYGRAADNTQSMYFFLGNPF
jgi:NTE family protein